MLAIRIRVIDHNMKAEFRANETKALGNSSVTKDPERRLGEDRLDINAHRPSARHASPQYLVVKIEIEDGSSSCCKTIEGCFADGTLSAASPSQPPNIL